MSPRVVAVLAALTGVVPVTLAATEDEDNASTTAPSNISELWSGMRASGVWRTDYFDSSKTLDDATGLLGATLQLKALPTISDSIDGKLEVRATRSDIDGGGYSRIRLLEGYATARFAKADLYVGKQIVAWGRADGINPTDNLSPRDFTVLLPFEDDQRLGSTAVRLDTFVTQEHTLTLFATPFFEPSEVPIPLVGGTVIENEPARTLSNTQVGIRLNRVGEAFDWSVSYYRGFSLLPHTRFIGGDLTQPALELHYPRITVLGADFARNFGRFGLRGEMAYVDTPDDAGTDAAVASPYLFWIAGIDRTFYENLNVNLQFLQRRVRSHQDVQTITDPLQRGAAIQNALIHGQQDGISNGISFRISNQWLNETLEAEIFAAVNITRDNSFLRPLVTYAFNDHWKGTVGGELYFGAQDTQYGFLKRNRGAFVEVRYGF